MEVELLLSSEIHKWAKQLLTLVAQSAYVLRDLLYLIVLFISSVLKFYYRLDIDWAIKLLD
jgi:hypothetical protein